MENPAVCGGESWGFSLSLPKVTQGLLRREGGNRNLRCLMSVSPTQLGTSTARLGRLLRRSIAVRATWPRGLNAIRAAKDVDLSHLNWSSSARNSLPSGEDLLQSSGSCVADGIRTPPKPRIVKPTNYRDCYGTF